VKVEYPAEPWRLRGNLHLSVFLVPLAEVPVEIPPDCRPIRLGRYAVVGTAWVDYRAGSVLVYDELMSTLLVRRGWRALPTITHIWVDSVASREGGRALWGIPKELATFNFSADRFAGSAAGALIAMGTVAPRFAVPGRMPFRFHVVQALGGAAKVTPVAGSARLALSRAEFSAAAGGPLGFLARRRPLASFSLLDFRLTFGRPRPAGMGGDRTPMGGQ
jgi:hypothetical protein